MEITDIEAIPVEIDVAPLTEEFGVAPYVAGHTTVETTSRLVIRVETDENIVGWGETTTEPEPTVAMRLVETVIEPELIGRNVWEIEDVLEAFGYQYVRVTPYLGGVEMALWDALGKRLGVPIHQLLGGKQTDDLAVAYCVGILDPERSAEQARWAQDQGFDVVKTKGGLDMDHDVERIVAMDEAVDGQLQFRLDGNQTMNFEEATAVAARLEDEGVYLQYFEQPIRIDNVGGYKRFRQRHRTPIAVNEDAYHERNVFQLVREDAIDAVVVDMVPIGGLLATKKLMGLCDDAGISVAHHSAFDLGIKTAAVLQFAATSSTMELPPDRVNYALEADVVEERFEISEGRMAVPDSPGLGVSVSEANVREHRVKETDQR